MGAVRVLVTTNSSPTATVPVESAPRFHPKNTSCFQEPIADHPRAFPDLQALRMTQPMCGVNAGACKIHKESFHSSLPSTVVLCQCLCAAAAVLQMKDVYHHPCKLPCFSGQDCAMLVSFGASHWRQVST